MSPLNEPNPTAPGLGITDLAEKIAQGARAKGLGVVGLGVVGLGKSAATQLYAAAPNP